MTKKSSKPHSEAESQMKLTELNIINKRLHRQLLKCQMENQSLKNKIEILEQELEDEKKKPKYSDLRAVAERIGKDNIEKRKAGAVR